MSRYIVTSALPYVNGVKHLGNLIGSLLPADVFARFLRMRGHDVLAVCGTDEHGTPSILSAIEEELPVEEYARKFHEIQKGIYERFGLSFNHFGRTSDPANHEITQHLFLRLHENGLTEEQVVRQVYCLNDKMFLPDRFLRGTCPHCGYEKARGDQCENCTRVLDPPDLIDARCAICGGNDLEVRESKHLFLNLPLVHDRISKWVETKEQWPPNVAGIARKWLSEGLRSRCITRDLEWGVKVPLPGYEDKVFYVWFDAPIGYIGISIEWARNQGKPDLWKEYWKKPETRLVQFMAKDNVPFHTVTWPATMMGADDGFVLADMVKGFEWLQYENGKFSTSDRRGVFTDQALELFPADYWRYALLQLAPERSDSNFTWEDFQALVNSGLNDTLGNLVQRCLTMLNRRLEGIVPEDFIPGDPEKEAFETATAAADEIAARLEEMRFGLAIRALHQYWISVNKYIDTKAPWKEFKENPAAGAVTLGAAAHLIRTAAVLSAPFLPFTATRIFRYLGSTENVHSLKWEEAKNFDALRGIRISDQIEPLFRKVTEEETTALKARFSGQNPVK